MHIGWLNMISSPRARRHGLLALLVVAVVLLAACTSLEDDSKSGSTTPQRTAPSPSTTTTLPPAPGEVPLFYAKDGRIHVSADASSPGVPITDGPNDDQPAPSPDASQVAFVRSGARTDPGGELWVVNADGSGAKQFVHPELLPIPVDAVTPYVRRPSWSPNGEQIAFVVPGELESGLLVVAEAASGALREMAPPPLVNDVFAWSPDAAQIAYMTAPVDGLPVEIGVMDADTGETRTLVGRTNATGVTWATPFDVLFSNAAAPSDESTRFDAALSGLFEVTMEGTLRTSVAQPTIAYLDPAVLAGVEQAESVGYATRSSDPAVRTLTLWRLDILLSPAPQLLAEGIVASRPATAWNAASEVAYLVDEQRRVLSVLPTDPEDSAARVPRTLDEGVSTFAWPPPSIGAAPADIPPQ
jgi:hypothetical protein